MLNRITFGAETAQPPLLIAHGLFGSARNWGVVAKRLADERLVVSVDMRNHGDSFWDDAHGYAQLGQDLAKVAADLGGTVDLLGHSMGGKAAMALALERPAAVRNLVVADIAPVAYEHTQAHLIDALREINLASVEKRSDADDQLARHVEEPSVRAFLLQSLDVKAREWRLNLDALAATMDEIVGWHAPEGRFDGPTLFLSGGESDYVRRADRETILGYFPEAKFARIPGAGHWLHAEKPREFEAAVRAFLA